MLQKRKKWLMLPLLLCLLLSFTLCLLGNVSFSKQNAGNSDAVFIAGNPDLYPLESYNEKTGEYEGVLPELFKAISKETGINFTYVYSSSKNRQEYLAKNKQVDIVSAMVTGKVADEYLQGSSLLVGFTLNGESYKAHIGFTSVCDASIQQTISKYLTDLPQETLTEMAISYVMANPVSTAVPDFVWWLIAVGVLLLVLIIILLAQANAKLRTKQNKGGMYEEKTGFYKENYIVKALEELVPIEAQVIYYVAYISVDVGKLIRYYGKETAEALTQHIAGILRAECGEKEYCARLKDVSFALVFRAENVEIAEARISALTEKINGENSLKDEDYGMHVRAGVHALSFRLPEGQTPFEIAQEAFEWAEKNGVAYCFSSSELVRERARKLMLQKETARAVRKEEILYYLQYVVDAKTGEVAGAESVSRWQHPREGLLMPSVYLPLMHQAQTISLLDYYMFEKSCQQLELWRKSGLTSFFLSCNFDRTTISQEDFFDKLSDIAKKYDIDKSKMILEITEAALESDQDIAHRNTALCVQDGYRIALDDFGNGFSSFRNLLEFNVSYMKLDRSFIRQIASERGKTLLRGLVSAVQRADIKVIFEGVETAEQRDEVARLGVDYVQGFYYSRVIPQIESDRILDTIKAKLRGEDLRSELQKTYDGYGEDEDIEEETVFDVERGGWVRVRYRWSFLARLHHAPTKIASYYTALKNEFLSYRKLKSRISWSYDSINFGRTQIAKFVMKQKSLMVYLALDPKAYEGTKYFFKDTSNRKKYAQVPMRIKVRSERGLKYTLELIEALAEKYSFKRLKERIDKDYSLAPLELDALIELGLVKVNETVMEEEEQIKRRAIAEAAFTKSVVMQSEEREAARVEAQKEWKAEPIIIETNMESDSMEEKVVMAINEQVSVNYRWSFTARLHKAPSEIAAYYTQIKNAFLQYRRVKSRVSWGCDTINCGREPLAKIVMAQKAMYVYLALDPKDYEDSKYFFKDFSDKKRFEKTPMRIKVRSERGLRYVVELLEKFVQKYELRPLKNFVEADYALPDKSFDELLELGLIKRVERKQSAATEDEAFDEAFLEEAAVADATDTQETVAETVEKAVEETEEEPVEERVEAVEEKKEVVIEQNLCGSVEDLNAEEIHVQFLERLCRQFDADEIDAHVKVVYKKKNEKKTSIFDIIMKRNKK